MRYKKLNDIELDGKSVLLRLDLNTPIENGLVTNNERIIRSLPTLNYIIDAGARMLIMSHLGRPEENDTYQKEYSLAPVVSELEKLLAKKIPLNSLAELEAFEQTPKIAVIENTRFNVGEKTNDPQLSQRLANLADVFVMDAFATSHRAHASTEGVIKFSDEACAGLLLEEELNALNKVKDNSKSSIAILGGAKISTKLSLIDSLANTMDKIILGGGIANTCIAAMGYEVGKSLVEESMLPEAQNLLLNPKIIIPKEVIVSEDPNKPGRVTSVNSISKNEAIFDIAPSSLIDMEPVIKNAGTILWNGPIGFFEKENYDKGTIDIAKMIISSKGFSVAGGGDTISAADKAGVLGELGYVSTAGGAFLEFMEGKKLPAIEALENKLK